MEEFQFQQNAKEQFSLNCVMLISPPYIIFQEVLKSLTTYFKLMLTDTILMLIPNATPSNPEI